MNLYKKNILEIAFKLPVLLSIHLYQVTVSLIIPSRCKFYPTCSHYCKLIIKNNNIINGIILSISRIVKCSPLSNQKYDPIITKIKYK
jgi:hypothetical protein